LLFFWAASTLDTTLVRASLGAWLPFALAHFIFHFTHLGGLSTSEKIFQTIILGFLVVLPVALLRTTRRKRSSGLGSLR